MKTNKEFLAYLNTTYAKLYTTYEKLFWKVSMGEKKLSPQKIKAMRARDDFQSDSDLFQEVTARLQTVKGVEKDRLELWQRFFGKYATSKELAPLRSQIDELEAKIAKTLTSRTEGYIDPTTKKFVALSDTGMRGLMRTSPDEALRKACFDAMEKLALETIDEYVELVQLRNQYAQKAGFANFYEYKADNEEEMTVKDLFAIFEPIYEKTKYAFLDLQKLEREKLPGLLKPWNQTYMLAGNFIKEEDPYFQFETALSVWGETFAKMGIDFAQGTLRLDLLDRKGKYNNGFCHWPVLVSYKGARRIPGESNFTCTVVPGQIGAGSQGLNTLFHEGGHAAHLLNSTERDVCINHEYAPMSVSWAEVQSMFLDDVSSSIEWRMRYAKNSKGESYPFDLYERKVKVLEPLIPLRMMSIMSVMSFEREIYEMPASDLTSEKVIAVARATHRKYSGQDHDSVLHLAIPHIYSWHSSAYYHGYGLAEIVIAQWKEYFHKKYGYIVDNPNIGKEMKAVWKYGARYTTQEFVQLATKKSFDVGPYIRSVTMKTDERIKESKKRIARLAKVPFRKLKKIDLKARIELLHGPKKITSNEKGFEKMIQTYNKWLAKQK